MRLKNDFKFYLTITIKKAVALPIAERTFDENTVFNIRVTILVNFPKDNKHFRGKLNSCFVPSTVFFHQHSTFHVLFLYPS